MRVTSSSFYNNIYGEHNKANRQMFDVTKQISSGLKIQYAHEDPTIFVDTLRLDSEITTLTQVQKSVDNGYKFSTQTDSTIGQIVEKLEQVKVKMLHAANEIHSDISLQAIAKELRGLQTNLISLANSSIGGQFLFSGSATTTQPIGQDGTYQGNNENLESFMGTGLTQKYNLTGAQLFLGEEKYVNRTVVTNMEQLLAADKSAITPSSTIADLMGDTTGGMSEPSYFYINGTRSDGTAFKSAIEMDATETVDDLLKRIALAYDPNQANPQGDQIEITLNSGGQIQIVDRFKGSSQLDFHMVGAVDLSGSGAADVTDIDALQLGTTDFATASAAGAPPNSIFVKEFTRSGFLTPAGTLNKIEGINYDRTNFSKDGASLISNVPQIVKSDNSIAQPTTKLLDVAGVASGSNTLIGTTLNLQGKNIYGVAYDLQIDLTAASSVSGTVGGVSITTFNIYNADTGRTAANADTMTYQQLLDVVNMAVSGSLPASNSAVAYDAAITTANLRSSTTLDYAGRMVVKDKIYTDTQAAVSLYDDTSDTYPATDTTTDSGSSLVFNANSALTVRDPRTDFFGRLEEVIQSVEQGKYRSDGTDGLDPRNVGIEEAIAMIDDITEHTTRMQTEAGTYSQTLLGASERTEILIMSATTLRSDVIDTDIAEAHLRMQQLQLNYQAMLSSISKVSELSLVKYL
ncbi:MAG: flagellar hook-associated protein FlgL [Sulfuricurvum sp.]|nr:flagellar hook-associated protein FlgL [Sulfuricurvum sp.]